MSKLKVKSEKLKVLYVLHGWSYSTDKWGSFLKELEKRSIEPKFLKIPGLSAPINRPWTLDDYVEWLSSQITVRNSQVVLLGHSNGGRIALAFALKYPTRVKQLILIDSAGIKHNDFTSITKRVVFKSLAKLGKTILPKSSRAILYKIAREEDYKRATPVMRKTMQNLISSDLAPRLKEINTPTTIIWGKDDWITPYKDAKTMHSLIRSSKLYPVENARHSPMFTNVPEVAEIVTRALS